MTIETLTVTQNNQYTTPITVTDDILTISIRGINNNNTPILFMRKRLSDSTYRLIEKFSDDTEENYYSKGTWQYILGCDTGYTAGREPINLEIEG